MRQIRLAVLAAAIALCCGSLGFAQPTQPFAPGADVMTAPVQPGYFAHQKVVYQNDGGQPDEKTYFTVLLFHIANHIKATSGDAEIRVVSFGRGVQMFLLAKTDPSLAKQIDDLKAKGVRFLVCRNTMAALKVRPEDLYHVSSADVVPAGVAEIARLQNLGYDLVHP
jgi:intracellular sulfur oxidation DsrE/DsrF family protein